MFLVRLEDFTGKKWDMLKHVEIFVGWKVRYGEYIWQFCMDDLDVEFSKAGGTTHNMHPRAQGHEDNQL